MAIISEVAEGVYLIETQESNDFGSLGQLQGCSIYLVVDEVMALIDTGPAVVSPLW